jgi:ATP dependent DNA ligase C terminal region
LVAYAQFGSACCTRADSRRTNRAVFLWAPDGIGEPWPRWRVWKGTYISDPSSHVKDSFISSESSEPRAEISRHRQADRDGCRDLTCGSPQHGAGTGEGRTRSDWGADEKVGKLIKLKAATSPFGKKTKDEAVTTWVKPQLVAEVKFTEWTSSGEMRHPVYLGLRKDKPAENMTRELEEDPGH